jgi:hypothetical protein
MGGPIIGMEHITEGMGSGFAVTYAIGMKPSFYQQRLDGIFEFLKKAKAPHMIAY